MWHITQPYLVVIRTQCLHQTLVLQCWSYMELLSLTLLRCCASSKRCLSNIVLWALNFALMGILRPCRGTLRTNVTMRKLHQKPANLAWKQEKFSSHYKWQQRIALAEMSSWNREQKTKTRQVSTFAFCLPGSCCKFTFLPATETPLLIDSQVLRLLSTLQMIACIHGYKTILPTVRALNEKSDIKKQAKAWSPSAGGLSEKNYCCSTSLPAEPTATNVYPATASCSEACS